MIDDRRKSDILAEASRLAETAGDRQKRGLYYEAEMLYEQALALREEAAGHDSLEYALGLIQLGELYQDRADHLYDDRALLGKAIELFRSSLNIRERLGGCDQAALIADLSRLAEACVSHSLYEEAEAFFLRLLAACENLYGAEALETAEVLKDLAHLYYFIGKYCAAEPLYLRVLAIWENKLGREHPKVAGCVLSLAFVYLKADTLGKDPESFFRRALEIREKAYGPVHYEVGEALYRLGDFLEARGRSQEAGPLYAKMLAIFMDLPDLPDERWSWMRHGYFDYLRAQGRQAEADALADRFDREEDHAAHEERLWLTIERDKAALGPEHPVVVEDLHWLARFFYGNKHEPVRAAQLYREALAIRERALGAGDPATMKSALDLSRALQVLKQYAEAEALIVRVLEVVKTRPDPSEEYADSLERLASLRESQGRPAEAERLRQEALAVLVKAVGAKAFHAVEAFWGLARFFVRQKQWVKAEEAYRRLLEVAADAAEVDALEKADYMESFIYVLKRRGKSVEAEEMRRRVKEIWASAGKDREDL